MIKKENTLLLLIPYLTVCGVLYNIGYWDTFGLNGLNYISVSDIIKSAIYPFTKTIGIMVPVISALVVQLVEIKEGLNIKNNEPLLNKKEQRIVGYSWIGTFAILAFVNQYPFLWYLFTLLFPIIPSIIIYNSGFLKEKFTQESNRLGTIFFLLFLLVFFYASGQYQSALVLNNTKYKYTIMQSNTTMQRKPSGDTLKYLGGSDKDLFFSDLKNQYILIIKSTAMDTLVLKDKE